MDGSAEVDGDQLPPPPSSTLSSSSTSRDAPPPTTVQVAIRIRPQGRREMLEMARVCTSVTPGEPQIFLGGERAFTFDHVFDMASSQEDVYQACASRLIDGTLEGYNATVLAYGQTGSGTVMHVFFLFFQNLGKTYTMGTAFESQLSTAHDEQETAAAAAGEDELGERADGRKQSSAPPPPGLIPRAVQQLFDRIDEARRKADETGRLPPSFDISVQFIELYNEEVKDLLAEAGTTEPGSVRIHEDTNGEIYLHGATRRAVANAQQTMECLKNGALNRTVGATNMNEESSRSHAIFSLFVKQQRLAKETNEVVDGDGMELLSAKFHFVDLAGSERLKRTGATGERAKEGISINQGLLALGNVISALGGASGRVSHVPYRDSKLTRLLQDSLGGNSSTLMVACISPSDSDFVETLNTLKYANRAKNIKNKVVANQDKSSRLISELRRKIAQLETELLEFRQGRRTVDAAGDEVVNDMFHENTMLTAELNQLRFRVKMLHEASEMLRARNAQLASEKIIADAQGGGGGTKPPADGDDASDTEAEHPATTALRTYVQELENTRAQLFEAQATNQQLLKDIARLRAGGGGDRVPATQSAAKLISEARANVQQLKEKMTQKQQQPQSDTISINSANEELADDAGVDDLPSVADEEDADEMDEAAVEVEQSTQQCEKLRDDLVDLQTEIGIKEQLIEELERSERKLAEVRAVYEKKMGELWSRIRDTETERDRVLSQLTQTASNPSQADADRAKRIRDEYERRLSDMRGEFRKLQVVEKEHKRMQARQKAEREQLARYQADLTAMKKQKVELSRRLAEESRRLAEEQRRTARRLAGMERENRQKELSIRRLADKDRQREQFITRTVAEMARLRRTAPATAPAARNAVVAKTASPRHVSSPSTRSAVSSRVTAAPAAEPSFNPAQARVKWASLQILLGRALSQRASAQRLEEKLEKACSERTRLLRLISQLERDWLRRTDYTERAALGDQLDASRAALSFLQDQIQDVQASLAALDTPSKDEEDADSAAGVNSRGALPPGEAISAAMQNVTSRPEAVYLLEQLVEHSLTLALRAQREREHAQVAEARVSQLERTNEASEQLLSSFITQQPVVDELDGDQSEAIRKRWSAVTNATPPSPSAVSLSGGGDGSLAATEKIRKRTATPEQLLFAATAVSAAQPNPPPIAATAAVVDQHASEEIALQATAVQPSASPSPMHRANRGLTAAAAAPAAAPTRSTTTTNGAAYHQLLPVPGGVRGMRGSSSSPSFSRNSPLRATVAGSRPSTSSSSMSAARPISVRSSAPSPLGTGGGDDVAAAAAATKTARPSASSSTRSTTVVNGGGAQLSRLTRTVLASSIRSAGSTALAREGRVVPIAGGETRVGRVLTRTHTLEGHGKGVLSVASQGCRLLTGSKDRLAKLWDVERGVEIRSLGMHINNVTSVRFVPDSTLALSVSMYQIRLFDLRTADCIHVLTSSGQVNEGDAGATGSRKTTLPLLETTVAAAEVDPTGRLLFSSCGADVRIWSLQRMAAYGRLVAASPNPKSEVSCLAVSTANSSSTVRVYTGSRDHCVKTYEVTADGAGLFEAAHHFHPPHYDNVTSVLPWEDSLFTTSKDKNIMRFSLSDRQRDHLEIGAHNSYIQSLCLLRSSPSPLLVSACKEGTIKLWDITTNPRGMRLADELAQAHVESINSMCVSADSQLLFTASSDQTVGLWRVSGQTT